MMMKESTWNGQELRRSGAIPHIYYIITPFHGRLYGDRQS